MLDRLIPLIVVFAAAPIHGAELPTELKVLSYDEQVEALKSESSKTLVHLSAKKMPEPTPAEIREYEKKDPERRACFEYPPLIYSMTLPEVEYHESL